MKHKLFKKSLGFTLIELLVVVAIIAVLAAVVMAALSSARGKGFDSKIVSQVGQMTGQGFLFSGTTGTAYVVAAPYQVSAGITGAAAGGTAASGTLFNDTTVSRNSLYYLANALPGSTYIYYGWDGADPNLTGRWFFAASTATGAYCNDNKGTKRTYTFAGGVNTLAEFTTGFPNATAANGYTCS